MFYRENQIFFHEIWKLCPGMNLVTDHGGRKEKLSAGQDASSVSTVLTKSIHLTFQTRVFPYLEMAGIEPKYFWM